MLTTFIVRLSGDSAINEDLTAVVRSTIEEYNKIFAASPPAGIRPIIIQYRSAAWPLTDSTTNSSTYYVFLTVNGRYYNQIVYQLAHELCHIFADPRRSNWFTECCCELASLLLLDKMSVAWGLAPPFQNWKSYAPTFKEYAQNHIRKMTMEVFNTECLPDQDQLQKWLATVSGSFKRDPINRPRNTIIALMLRRIFEEAKGNWDAIRFLGQASTNPPVSLTDLNTNSEFEFNKWEEVVPGPLKELVRRINRVFYKKITQ